MDPNYLPQIEKVSLLNKEVWCRLGPSKIHGIGVIAIRDIPKGTPILKASAVCLELTTEYLDLLHPAIKGLILDRHMSSGHPFLFSHPNRDASLQCFMNHSGNANFDGLSLTTRDIKEGEEITENYRTMMTFPHPKIQEHQRNFINYH